MCFQVLMEVIIIVTFLGATLGGSPWGITASRIGRRSITLEPERSNTNAMEQLSTEQTRRYTSVSLPGNLTIKDGVLEQNLSDSKASIFQDFEGNVTGLENEANVYQTILDTGRDSDTMVQSATLKNDDHQGGETTTTEKFGSSDVPSGIQSKCNCTAKQSYCCQSGCCKELTSWMNPIEIVNTIAWLSIISVTAGALWILCRPDKPDPDKKRAQVRTKSTSSLTCETSLYEDSLADASRLDV